MQQPITVDSPEVFSSEKETYYFDRKKRQGYRRDREAYLCFCECGRGKLVIGIEDDGRYLGSRGTVLARSRTSNGRQ